MADVNVLDLTLATPGSNDNMILFDKDTGVAKSTRFDTLKTEVLNSKFKDTTPAEGDVYRYDATAGEWKNSSQMQTLTNNLNSINSPTIRHISARKFVFVGDSYTQQPTAASSFVGAVVGALGLTSSQYHNIGINGASMSNYIQEVQNYAYNDENSITDVVVTGGLNDATVLFANSTLSTTIPAFISTCKAKFPNAIIWAGFCGNGLYELVDNAPAGWKYANVTNIKYLWKKHFSKSPYVIYMDRLDTWMRVNGDTDYFFGGSGVHPYGEGINILGCMIAEYLKGGMPGIEQSIYNTKIKIDYNLPDTSHIDISAYLNRHGSITKFSIGIASQALSEPFTLTNTNETELLTIPFNAPTISNSVYSHEDVSVSSWLGYKTQSGGTTIYNTGVTYTLRGNKIYMRAWNAVPAVGNIINMTYPPLDFILSTDAI